MSIGERAQAEAEKRWPVSVDRIVGVFAKGKRESFVAGAEWAASQEPTDDEVLAALNAQRGR